MHTPTYLRGGLALLALATTLATAACGPADSAANATAPTGTAGAVDDSFGVGPEPTAADPAPAPGPTDISPTYPATAEAYAKAVVTAWTQDQAASLASLSAPGVADQIADLLNTVNDQWTYLRCDGTAGSSYCSFTNVDGDLLTLRITHSLLSKAHAAIEVKLEKTVFPNEGVAYVKEFVKAWQFGNTARMLVLSSQSIVTKTGTAPTSPTYPVPDCCGGGLLQVKVVWAGKEARFDVGTTKLSGPHAIVGFVGPQLPISS